MKLILLFLTSLALANVAIASCSASGSCSDVQITSIRSDIDGNSYLGTSGIESNLTCTPGDKGSENEQIMLDSSGENYNAVYSLALTSYKTNSLVTIRTNNVSGSACEVAYITVSD